MAKSIWVKPASDFTIYKDRSTLERLSQPAASVSSAADAGNVAKPAGAPPTAIPYFDQTICFAWHVELEKGNELDSEDAKLQPQLFIVYRARSLACCCFNKSLSSITLRLDDESQPQPVLRTKPGAKAGDPLTADDLIEVRFEEVHAKKDASKKDQTVWRVETSETAKIDEPFIGVIEPGLLLKGKIWHFPSVPGASDGSELRGSPPFLFSADAIVKVLFPAIYRPNSEDDLDTEEPVIKHGLVVISGQTGTLKSTILRGLLRTYLGAFNFPAWGKRRYPHVITLEDPIEKPMVPLRKMEDYYTHPSRSGINFTPRQIGNDVPSLKQGLKDALRQTPAAILIGETRDRKDWIELLKFAATGHLCFTTTHAGSLVETMRTIIEATHSTTPDLRSSLVEKIIAVVHLRSFNLTPAPESASPTPGDSPAFESMLLPAIWRNVSGGANFFISDGLSAILPRRAEGKGKRAPSSCRGRSDFARALLAPRFSGVDLRVKSDVMNIATRADLEGV